MDAIEQWDIAEVDHRILNPFTDGKLMLLGEVCRLKRTHELGTADRLQFVETDAGAPQ